MKRCRPRFIVRKFVSWFVAGLGALYGCLSHDTLQASVQCTDACLMTRCRPRCTISLWGNEKLKPLVPDTWNLIPSVKWGMKISHPVYNIAPSLQFLTQFTISRPVYNFSPSLQFRTQFTISHPVYNFSPSLQFLTQFTISRPVYNFAPSLQFLTQFTISHPVYNFSPSLQFLTQFTISHPVYNFSPSLQFLTQFTISHPVYNFLQQEYCFFTRNISQLTRKYFAKMHVCCKLLKFGICDAQCGGWEGPAEGRKRGPASVFSLLEVFLHLQGSLSRGETSEGYYPGI